MCNKVELLAPAGNPQAFYAIINAGADAVYLAGNKFGARAYADNFSTDELIECIQYAHLFSVKVYLTFNTLLKESEISEIDEFIKPLYEAGLDAAIIQDFGVVHYLKEHYPNLEIHISTQMSVCSSYGAKFLKELGATRIVPARELSLKEIRAIKSKVDIELETFIHGAMCYCYSGMCLFSSILGGRSGNRGRCAQPCRLSYSVINEGFTSKDAYYLSLKDMCTIEKLSELISAGIDSFKIEGRMKKPEYAAGVTSIYRKYIDYYYSLVEEYGEEEAQRKYSVNKKDLQNLSSLYIRSEVQDGYYFKQNGKEMITLTNPSYNSNDERLLQDINTKYMSNHKKISISMVADFKEGNKAKLIIQTKDITVEHYGNIVETAQKQAITEDNVKKQLLKLGETVFTCDNITITVSEKAFYPLKMINELRREAIEKLVDAILNDKKYSPTLSSNNTTDWNDATSEGHNSIQHLQQNVHTNEYALCISNSTQLKTYYHWLKNATEVKPPKYIYISDSIVFDNDCLDICAKLSSVTDCLIMLPYIMRENKIFYFENLLKKYFEKEIFKGFLVRNADELGYISECVSKSDKDLRNIIIQLDACFYTWNHYALKELYPYIDGACVPYELKTAEQHRLLEYDGCFEKILYSKIPMMITSNCVLQTSDKCHKNSTQLIALKDRYGKVFPIVRNCSQCYNVIYNSVPLCLLKDKDKWKYKVRIRLDFTTESADEMILILDAFFLGKELYLKEYTTGHEKRGVE